MEELKPASVMEDDQWMNYLRNSNVDIFDIIKKAITVAASDHPQEFHKKKDMIAETLFTCGKKSMINDKGHDENEDEKTTVAKVLNIVLEEINGHECSESVLLESLSKLKHMVKSVYILKVTGVGITVNGLRKHASTHVANMSRALVNEWKLMVKEWMKDTENMQQQKGCELETNPKNPPKIEKQLIVPAAGEKRSLIVRIKLKKDEPKGPVTPELQKVKNKNDDCVSSVLKIKEILDDESVSKSIVLESLVKLLDMSLSLKTLRDTGICRSVRVLLQNHEAIDVRQIAWGLLKKWECMMDKVKKNESSLKAERKTERVVLEDTNNLMKMKKFEARKRKMENTYEEVEKMKKRRSEPNKKVLSAQIKPRIRMNIRR